MRLEEIKHITLDDLKELDPVLVLQIYEVSPQRYHTEEVEKLDIAGGLIKAKAEIIAAANAWIKTYDYESGRFLSQEIVSQHDSSRASIGQFQVYPLGVAKEGEIYKIIYALKRNPHSHKPRKFIYTTSLDKIIEISDYSKI